MAKRRLLLVAVFLLAIGNIWIFSDYIGNSSSEPKAELRDARPPVTKLEPLSVFPAATRVNLLIKNGRLTSHEPSTNPDGVDLTKQQRQELESAIKKSVTVRPAGKDYPGEGSDACFIPHHFFRYYDISGKKIGEIEICFCCEGGDANPALASSNRESEFYDVKRIKALVKKMNLPTETQC